MEKLFSYGTLQDKKVQVKNFGRELSSKKEVLLQYELRGCQITDPSVLETSGKGIHPIACFTGNANDEIKGAVFEITAEELAQADSYEVDDYKRIKCVLKSGDLAWVYVQSGLNIDEADFIDGDIKLEVFKDEHIEGLCAKAADARIWQHHKNNFEDAEIFKQVGIAKAKKDIANKSRFIFTIFYKDEIIGSTSYYNISLSHLKCDIGYTWIHPDYWGKGINSIVKNMMLNYAFEKLKFRRVGFCIDSKNLRSRSALEKLGASFEGILKNQQVRPDGSKRDSAIYSILKRD